jgi:hypothetical protein
MNLYDVVHGFYYHSNNYHFSCRKLWFLLPSLVLLMSVSSYKSSPLPSHHTNASSSIPTTVKPGTWIFMIMLLPFLYLAIFYLFTVELQKQEYELQFVCPLQNQYFVILVQLHVLDCKVYISSRYLGLNFHCIFDLQLQHDDIQCSRYYSVKWPLERECAVVSFAWPGKNSEKNFTLAFLEMFESVYIYICWD